MSLADQPESPQYPAPRTRLERIAADIRSKGRDVDTLEIFTREWIDGPLTRHVVTIDAITQLLEVDGAIIPTLEQFTEYWLLEVRIAIADGRATRIERANP